MINLKLSFGMLLAVAVLFAGPAIGSAGDGHKEAGRADAHAGEEKDAHAGEEAGGRTESGVGPGKAVEGIEHGRRIKLSAKAVTRLEIRTGNADMKDGRMVVPVEALVAIRGNWFVFTVNGRWFEYRPVEISGREGGKAFVGGGLGNGEEIVLKGAGILRLVELDIEAGEKGGGHSH